MWLDTKLTAELVAEGMAREFVSRVQKLRKDSGLEVTDRIHLAFWCPPELKAALHVHKEYISNEVLAATFAEAAESGGRHGQWTTEQEIDAFPLKIRLEKA